ncbi:hypothetical protein DEO23_01085 [Brachybacterium endophyticum]|uniref:Glycoside hydrolase family 127 protein n=1 Tax=Brachybacterium endophyticum TaxID=2182385 RepID=A0A2U2RN32_9MICO|nr:beta-L-arabinofuranosidase domain-containing protein [Brachybacterium endophyticum]PWH07280.1 hypothetical protein DEO23_01085 [Brachybacterium endophyticum]
MNQPDVTTPTSDPSAGPTPGRVAPAPPVRPSAGGRAARRPLGVGAARITGGFWGQRLRTNAATAIAGGYDRLEEAGSLRNLRIAGGLEDGEITGMIFQDSDVHKWLEAVAFEIGRTGDAHLLELQRRVTAWVAAAQREDGYIDTVHEARHGTEGRWTNLTFEHELYCAGHLIQAAVAQHRCTDDRGLLEVAVRCADLLVATFGPGKRDGVPGHPEIEMALVELFRETGERSYLDLARFFLDRRGHGVLQAETGVNPSYFSDRVPVAEARSVEGHAVRAVYLAAGVVDRALETGEEQLLAQQEALFADMMATKAYVSGGLGARWDGEAFGAPYELPADRGYAETCAAIGAVQWAWRLLLATGRETYAEAIEQLLLNAMLPGVSLDGAGYFYVNPLQVRSGTVLDDPRNPVGGRQGWFDCACCPPNLMRTLASLAQYVATGSAQGMHLHQYASGSYAAGGLRIDVETGYPLEGEVQIVVREAPSGPTGLSLRVPRWANAASVEIPEHLEETWADGAVQITGTFTPGDRIMLTLPIEPRLVVGHPRLDAVAGSIALLRGPLLYTLEQVDQAQGVDIERIEVLPGEGADVRPAPEGLAALPGGDLPALAVRARRRRDEGEELYPVWAPRARSAAAGDEEAEVNEVLAVPYFAWANRQLGPMRVWMPVADRR